MRIETPGFRIRRSFEIAFSLDGTHLAVVGRDVSIWSVVGRCRLRATRLVRHPSSVVFSPDGSKLLIKSTRGELHVCETSTADPITICNPVADDEGSAPRWPSNDNVVDASWSGEIRVRTLPGLEPTIVWRDGSRMVAAVSHAANVWAFATVAKHANTARAEPPPADAILVGEWRAERRLEQMHAQWRGLGSIALSPCGTRLAIRHGYAERAIEIRTLDDEVVLASDVCSVGGTGDALAWAPDGTVVVLVSDGGFSFRNADTLQEVGWLPSEYPSHIAFDPTGQLVALGDWSQGFVAAWPELLFSLKPRANA